MPHKLRELDPLPNETESITLQNQERVSRPRSSNYIFFERELQHALKIKRTRSDNSPWSSLRRVNHVSRIVKDHQASFDFYNGILGLDTLNRPNFKMPGYWFNLETIQLHLITASHHEHLQHETMHFEPAVPSLTEHIALIAHDMADVEFTLQQKNWTYRRFIGHYSKTVFLFLRDPDGHQIEICDNTLLESIKNKDFARGLDMWPEDIYVKPAFREEVKRERRRSLPGSNWEKQRLKDSGHFLGVSHLTRIVADLARSVKFYKKRLHLPILSKGNGFAVVNVGEFMLRLVQDPKIAKLESAHYHNNNRSIPDGNVNHIAFETTAFEDIRNTLKRFNVAYDEVLVDVTEDKKMQQLFIQDPDGYYLEICDCHLMSRFVYGEVKDTTDANELAAGYMEGVPTKEVEQDASETF